MNKKVDENFESSSKYCWIIDNTFTEGDYKVRDNCHIAANCRGAAHR